MSNKKGTERMFTKSLILPVLKDREMLKPYTGVPDKTIKVCVKYDCPIFHPEQDEELNIALAMLNQAINTAFLAYEDKYDFWVPNCIATQDGEIETRIEMKRKPESQEDGE